ncbi:MAG: hypothetical protein K8U03_18910 [Planctomycetia bacterium]|nr:hypothetical protein [Planctomycetia bacterium]
MLPTPTPTLIRQLVVEHFTHFGAQTQDAEACAETILIRDGKYRGRSYRAGGMLAMWMIEIGLVQFYAADGAMLATVSLHDRAAPQMRKMAA